MANILSQKYKVLLLLAIVGFSVYSASFAVPFFWDDNDNVVNNVYVKSWFYLPKYFSENLIAGAGLLSNYWRPFLLITYSLDYHFFGLNQYWWHFVDVSLHVLNAFLLFLVLSSLFKRRWFSLAVSLIFLIHPIQTEAITQITGRADPLAFFLLMLSIFFYLKKRWALSIFAFLLALLTKETAIILPALLILIEICFHPNEEKLNKHSFLKTLPFFVLAGVYFAARLTVLNFKDTLNFYEDASAYSGSFFVRLLTFLKVLPNYFSLLLYPHNLHPERSINPAANFSWDVAITIIMVAAVFIFSIIRYKRDKNYFFGISWFFISLFPASGILIPINRMIYEHWLYVPLIGFFIFFLSLIKNLKLRFIIIILGIGYLLFLGTATFRRNIVWQDPVIFYNDILKYNQQSLMVWNNLGMEYADKNEIDKAIECYKKAIELDIKKQSAPPHHNLANAYKTKGLFEEAAKEYKTAISIDKNFYFSYNGLADLYLKEGDQKKAEEILEKEKSLFQKKNLKN